MLMYWRALLCDFRLALSGENNKCMCSLDTNTIIENGILCLVHDIILLWYCRKTHQKIIMLHAFAL